MSGLPPYTYLSLGNNLTALGSGALQYVADSEGSIIISNEGVDLFESGCISPVRPDLSYPIGSYNISYPYCRTALQVNMGDTRADPQIGQLIVDLPYLAVKIIMVGCEKPGVTSLVTQFEPPAAGQCAAEIYPGNTSTEFYLIVSKQGIVLPARFTFTVNNLRTFWVGFRDSRSGRPSGSLP